MTRPSTRALPCRLHVLKSEETWLLGVALNYPRASSPTPPEIPRPFRALGPTSGPGHPENTRPTAVGARSSTPTLFAVAGFPASSKFRRRLFGHFVLSWSQFGWDQRFYMCRQELCVDDVFVARAGGSKPRPVAQFEAGIGQNTFNST